VILISRHFLDGYEKWGKKFLGLALDRHSAKVSKHRVLNMFIPMQLVSISKEVLRSALDDAIDLTETALKAFDGPASCSALKVSITNLDSAFDEKLLGFKSFTDFLRSTESIQTTYDAANNTWYAYFSNSDAEISSTDTPHNTEAEITDRGTLQENLKEKALAVSPKTVAGQCL
jgi:hypothetical protein